MENTVVFKPSITQYYNVAVIGQHKKIMHLNILIGGREKKIIFYFLIQFHFIFIFLYWGYPCCFYNSISSVFML